MQLDLFHSDEYQYLSESIEKYKASADSVRRGLYQRMSEMERQYKEKVSCLESEILELKLLLERLCDQDNVYVPEPDFCDKVVCYH